MGMPLEKESEILNIASNCSRSEVEPNSARWWAGLPTPVLPAAQASSNAAGDLKAMRGPWVGQAGTAPAAVSTSYILWASATPQASR